MRFEFDPDKSEANKAKHGIDFVEAQRLWDDDNLIEGPARTDEEPRMVAIGMIDGKLWTAVYTMRGEMVRIISVRRARKKEASNYEGV